MNAIYLDHNATTAVDPAVLEEMLPFLGELPGNPSSKHSFGRKARQAVERSRERIAAALDCGPDEIVFTGGATEANNLTCNAIAKPCKVLVSSIEHPSALEPSLELKKRGFDVAELPVDDRGRVNVESLGVGDAGLVCIQLANSETGVIQPIAELADTMGAAIFHCDAAQAVGKIPVSFRKFGVATMAISAHKVYGPQGIGALIVRKGTNLRPSLHGGGQQSGIRPGTEPVALIVGFAAAVESAVARMAEDSDLVETLRDGFERLLLERHPSLTVNSGGDCDRLPNTTNVSFPGVPAAAMVMRLDLEGVACSAGSACASGSITPSRVLAAMGCIGDRLIGAVRFSLGRSSTEEEIHRAAEIVAATYTKVRESFGK